MGELVQPIDLEDNCEGGEKLRMPNHIRRSKVIELEETTSALHASGVVALVR